jgi:hypothetical protein
VDTLAEAGSDNSSSSTSDGEMEIAVYLMRWSTPLPHHPPDSCQVTQIIGDEESISTSQPINRNGLKLTLFYSVDSWTQSF